MTEPILSTDYWAHRLKQAEKKGVLHESIFRCPQELWRRIEEKHREILKRVLKPEDMILDAGCGWGRLLSLLPEEWKGWYVGVDHSPDFIKRAREQRRNQNHNFLVASLFDLSMFEEKSFDIAILISIRPMMIRNIGKESWSKMESEIRRVAKQILYLEYDPNCEGFLE